MSGLSKIAILLITHNRLKYTKKCLSALLRTPIPFTLVIVDNSSTDKTQEFLNTIKKSCIQIFYRTKHESLSVITNWFWQKFTVEHDLVGKIDNDTLVSPNWLERVIKVHQSSEQVGAVGGFPFDIYEDWNFEHSKQNIRELSQKQTVLVQPNIGGCAYIVKPRVIMDVGPLDEKIEVVKIRDQEGYERVALSTDPIVSRASILCPVENIIYGWQEWQLKAGKCGYINCYPFPLEVVEHMDDPLSIHCLLDKDKTVTELARKNAERRGLEYSQERVSNWTRHDGKCLFSQFIYRGNVGKQVYATN